MPMMAIALPTVVFWAVYWLVRWGKVTTVRSYAGRGYGASGHDGMSTHVASRPTNDPREAALALSLLLARVSAATVGYSDDNQQIRAIKCLARSRLGFGNGLDDAELDQYMARAHALAGSFQTFEQALDACADLLNGHLTSHERRDLLEMLDTIARANVNAVERAAALEAAERQMGFLPPRAYEMAVI